MKKVKDVISEEARVSFNDVYGQVLGPDITYWEMMELIEYRDRVFFGVSAQLDMEQPDNPKWLLSITKNNNVVYEVSGCLSRDQAYIEGMIRFLRQYNVILSLIHI